MKTTLRILSFFLILSVFPTCHLERIDSLNEDCPNPPVADFTLSTTEISLGESVTITNQSDPDAATYAWDFGNTETSDDFNASITVTYNTAGTHEIVLVVTDADGCSATARETITVTNEVKFKKILDLGTTGGIPLGAVERSDKKIHCLFNQSGLIKSILIDPLNLNVPASPVTIPANINVNSATPHNGGFLLAGLNGNSAKVEVINADQQKTGIEKEFQFTGSTTSTAWGAVMNSTDEVVCTGYRKTASPIIPGLARVTTANSITSPAISNSNLINYGGFSIVEQADAAGNYYIAANLVNPFAGAGSILISASQNGNYGAHSSLAPLTVAYKIIHVSGTTYLVIGRDNAAKNYLVVVKQGGNQIWPMNNLTAIGDVVISGANPNKVVICGSVSNSLYIGQINLSTGTPEWDESYSIAGGQLYGISIAKTSDGGYLVSCQYDHDGKSDFYLLKTNSLGQAE